MLLISKYHFHSDFFLDSFSSVLFNCYVFVCLFFAFLNLFLAAFWVFIAVHALSLRQAGATQLWCAGFLIAVASLVVEHGL